jgi:taurine--2-oxoglutarate transaminase
LQGVRGLCDEFGILMVCDEVMCGWGRTGRWFAVDHWNVKPDMITFAKGVTCGYVPLGGVIVNEKVARYFDDHPLMCGLTYSGHPVGCAAAIATIDVYKEEGLIEKAAKTGVFFKKQLEKLLEAHPCVGDVRAIGLFGAVELVRDKKTKEPLVPYGKDPQGIMPGILGMLKERGFWNYSHENILIVAPPLVITEGEISEALEILDEVLCNVDEGL